MFISEYSEVINGWLRELKYQIIIIKYQFYALPFLCGTFCRIEKVLL